MSNQSVLAPEVNSVAQLPSAEAVQVLESLQAQAASLLSAALGSTPLVPFATGGLGNFPYYWQNPSSYQFNQKTYDWIKTNLKANATPAQQDGGNSFTNEFIRALSSITYTLSSKDQAALNIATSNAMDQQLAILNQWNMIYGSLPPTGPGQTPIDAIVSIICTTWSSNPNCDLMAIQNSTNLNKLLDKTPASGKPILPLVANWVNALGSSLSLQNAVSMNNGYLSQALAAAQTPSVSNGGTTIGSGCYPTYKVATQLSDIINGLKATSNAVTLNMSVSVASSSEYQVSVNGGTSFRIPFLDFFSLGIGGNANYFHDEIANSASSIEINMTYTGVTLVQYAPVAFELSTGKNWYFMQPINEAIKNGTSDVSGYRFSPNPNIDFSANGPFAFIQGCAIANYPTVQIKVTSSNYASIQTTFQQTTSFKVSFLGIPLGGGSQSTYSNSASSNASAQQVTITLAPPLDLVAGTSVDSVGWILGVQTCYPGC
jgi:hypothetical protein